MSPSSVILLLLLGLTAGGPEVSIHLRVPVVWENEELSVTCRVPRRAENRWVEAGIEGFTSDQRPLDGEDGPVTNHFWVKYVPCGFDTAYCRVGDQRDHEAVARAHFTVAGCEP